MAFQTELSFIYQCAGYKLGGLGNIAYQNVQMKGFEKDFVLARARSAFINLAFAQLLCKQLQESCKSGRQMSLGKCILHLH